MIVYLYTFTASLVCLLWRPIQHRNSIVAKADFLLMLFKLPVMILRGVHVYFSINLYSSLNDMIGT